MVRLPSLATLAVVTFTPAADQQVDSGDCFRSLRYQGRGKSVPTRSYSFSLRLINSNKRAFFRYGDAVGAGAVEQKTGDVVDLCMPLGANVLQHGRDIFCRTFNYLFDIK